MPEKVSITKTKLDNLANAISAKSGEPLNLTIDEMEAAVNGINIGEENVLEGVKVNGVELPIDSQKKVNIPAVSQNKAGVMTPALMNEFANVINNLSLNKANKSEIPTSTSQLANDSNFAVDSNYVHTDNNFTTALKDKLDGVASGAEVNVQSDWNVTDTSSDAFIKNKPSIPTKVSDLTNDSNYQTDTEVETAITDALAGVVGFSIEIVNSLPATGDAGVFYFVPNSGEQNNIYDEYLYVNNAWEKLGTTEIDLSNYLQKTDIAAWAKAPNKPTYTAQEVGALPDTTVIPTKTSDLTNDSGFITSASLPTKVSDLTNDSGYITNSEEDDPVFTASAAYGIQSSDITNWNNKSDFSGNYNDLTNKPTIPSAGTSNPLMDGTASAGSASTYSKSDHVHPSDTTKVDKVTGKDLSTNDFTNELKTKLEGISNGAEVNVQADWDVTDTSSDAYIKNKPNIPSGVIVDSALSSTSENPVQNKVINTALADKVDKVTGKGLSTNDYTTDEKNKLAGIAAGAEVNVQSDWDVTDTSSDAFIKNKPTIPTVPTNVSAFTNDAGYLTSYTETDPVFSASPAAGITSSDITSWNNKVSDDKTWNGVTLDTSLAEMSNQSCRVPFMWNVNGETSARMMVANKVPTASNIAIYDNSAYLNSTTPSANDNSTKVATTAYVDAAIPTIPTNISSFTNDSGYLTLADLPIYDGAVI